jgi:hypothetical protein
MQRVISTISRPHKIPPTAAPTAIPTIAPVERSKKEKKRK